MGGNGEGYDGKPSGDFDLIVPQFKCEEKGSPYASISMAMNFFKLTVNHVDKCQKLEQGYPLSELVYSPMDPSVIAFRESLFDRRDSITKAPDLNTTIKAWCHSSQVAPFSPLNSSTVNGAADIVIRQTLTDNSALLRGTIAANTGKSFTSSLIKSINATTTNYVGVDFDLAIAHAETVGSYWGPHKGNLKVRVNGNFMVLNLDCRVEIPPVIGTRAEVWKSGSELGAPSKRTAQTSVWTGTDFLTFGGQTLSYTPSLDTGYLYNPALDTWKPMSSSPLAPQAYSSSVWTGSEMLIWGGETLNPGGAYNPTTDSWRLLNTVGQPEPRIYNVNIWTGSRMILWGGISPNGTQALSTGGVYDPATDSWKSTSLVNSPPGTLHGSGVWTGSKMIVWGGQPIYAGYTFCNTGGIYDPLTDTWKSASLINAPSPRSGHFAFWTGSKMVVWGGSIMISDGVTSTGVPRLDGGIYDPETDKWSPISNINVPPIDVLKVTWNGSQMLVVGWIHGNPAFSQILAYDPYLDRWTLLKSNSTLGMSPSMDIVWAGNSLLMWGGVTIHTPATGPLIYTPFQ